MEVLIDFVSHRANYVLYIVIMMVGLWAMVAKRNLVKKAIGLAIYQTAIMLFFVSIGSKSGATIPILQESDTAKEAVVRATEYINPLPHVLMLTAIVVGVATLGVALALIQKLYAEHKTLEEDELLERMRDQ
jgi:multicomponent Na+:H+ antiporter subunit C